MLVPLVAFFAMNDLLVQTDEIAGPPAIVVCVRALFLRPGLTEEQTLARLGLQETLPCLINFSINNSIHVYPLQPDYQLIIYFHLDASSKCIRHVLRRVKISNRKQKEVTLWKCGKWTSGSQEPFFNSENGS